MEMDIDSSGTIEPLELCSQDIGTGSVYQSWENGRINSLYCIDVGLLGEIPESILDLPNLREITLYNNQLSGVIPESICEKFSNIGYKPA